MNAITVFTCVVGLGLLILSAELLVRGASRLARYSGMSPLVVGLTVVAFGTSAPELFTSVLAGLSGQADLAVGNVVGSNIFNVLLILGISALITPLGVSRQVVRIDAPIMVGVSFLLLGLGWLGHVSRAAGLGLCVALAAYLFLQLRLSSRDEPRGASPALGADRPSPDKQEPVRPKPLSASVLLTLAGLVGLGVGSTLFIRNAAVIAQALGVSELVIGLTLVAGGTSLPEVAASIVAALRGERDMAVGNVIGSNIFNVLGVLGLTSLIAPSGVAISKTALYADIPVMVASAAACLPVMFTGLRINRWEGGLFLAFYGTYCTWLFLSTARPDHLVDFTSLLRIILPLTAISLAISVLASIRKESSGPSRTG
ncbi:calcium/sodium antiporter [Desulfonatronum thioautotrophicum]|uniref:calcium/sodium antiporter n=1 Tax=Desulfonatronum thioautotrophicum TaxID=617001 RepID=UPI0005EB39DC|nr:calcium/sodium antiporter [Desulfonatronum thioautotrophicum]